MVRKKKQSLADGLELMVKTANTLRGISMHLGIIARRSRDPGMEEPIEAINRLVAGLDAFEAAECEGQEG